MASHGHFTLPPAPGPRSCAPTTSTAIYFQVLGLRGELLGGELSLPYRPTSRPRCRARRTSATAWLHNSDLRIGYVWVATGLRPRRARPLVQVGETLGKRAPATEIIRA